MACKPAYCPFRNVNNLIAADKKIIIHTYIVARLIPSVCDQLRLINSTVNELSEIIKND